MQINLYLQEFMNIEKKRYFNISSKSINIQDSIFKRDTVNIIIVIAESLNHQSIFFTVLKFKNI